MQSISFYPIRLVRLLYNDTQNYISTSKIQGDRVATELAMSPNNYFVAAAEGKSIDLWNFRTRELRKRISFTDSITGMAFSADASQLAVTIKGSKLIIYDTNTWTILDSYNNRGSLLSPSYHPNGKYLSMVRNNRDLVVVNLKNKEIECSIDDQNGNVSCSHMFIDYAQNNAYILSNCGKSIIFWDVNNLNPYYSKLVRDEVEKKMNDWMRIMQGESMEEYAIRVNDETRLAQRNQYAQEASTKLAGDRLTIENPFVGNYDESTGKLDICFNSMPKIAIDVPANEVGDFAKGDKMYFDNAVYVLNDEDEFQLAYVEVKNEVTGKMYIYDNIGRLKLHAMEDDEGFVPLEVMQIAKQEEVKLTEIKETVVEEKKEEKLISENTSINVKTEILPGYDANGKKIYNYKIGYQYEVIDKAFSARDDFPSGGYDMRRSGAAMSLVKIIKNAFEGDFSKYLSQNKVVKVIITGSADASPIRGRIAYNGINGEYTNEPYTKNGNLDHLTVSKTTGITTNEQLAFLRAAGFKRYVEENVSTLKNTQNEYEFHVEVAKERGGEYRKINVEFIIMDSFPSK